MVMLLAIGMALAAPDPGTSADTDVPQADVETEVDTDAPQADVETEVDTDAPQADVDTEPDPTSTTAAAPADETTGADEAADAETITVYGEHLVEQARARVAAELREQGYTSRIRKEDYTVYRHPDTWKGEVRIYDDGWIRMRRQPVQFAPPPRSPLGWATCIAVPFCIRSGGQTVSRRKHMAQRRRALGELEPLARQYGDRVADLNVDRRLEDLPDRLYALWQDGVPLEDGAAPLPTPEARKQAILAYWDSRTDTVWGRRVRAAVEAFVREEVQYSPFAFTETELQAFNARRQSTDPLDLERPWEQVLGDLEERAGQ